MVVDGMEHEYFTNQFPFWKVNKQVQALNCKVRPTSLSHTSISQTRYYQLFYYYNMHKTHEVALVHTIPARTHREAMAVVGQLCPLALPDQIKYYMVVCL